MARFKKGDKVKVIEVIGADMRDMPTLNKVGTITTVYPDTDEWHCSVTFDNNKSWYYRERELEKASNNPAHKALKSITVRAINDMIESRCEKTNFKKALKKLIDIDHDYLYDREIPVEVAVEIAEEIGELQWLVEHGFVGEKRKTHYTAQITDDNFEFRPGITISIVDKNGICIWSYANS